MKRDPDTLRRRTGAECLSDYQLDLLVAAEFEKPGQFIQENDHLARCPLCAEKLAARENRQKTFLESMNLPSLAAAAIHRAQAQTARSPTFRLRLFMLAATAAAAVFLIVILLQKENPIVDRQPDVMEKVSRLKGNASFGFFVKRGQDQFLGENRTELQPKDTLRFFVTTERESYFALCDVESSGRVTPFVPADRPDALRIQAGPKSLMEGSIELDQSSGEEKLVGIFCSQKFSVQSLIDALNGWDRKDSSIQQHLARTQFGDCMVSIQTIHKKTSPR